ncbi:MAG: hypothetical protein ACP5HG_16020 [Anaerolineae bacterium]
MQTLNGSHRNSLARRCRGLLATALALILLGCSLITGSSSSPADDATPVVDVVSVPTTTPLPPTPVEESAPTAIAVPPTATPEAEPSDEPAGSIGPFTPFVPAPAVRADAIRDLRAAPTGILWLATDGAVLSQRGGSWAEHTDFDALQDGVLVGFGDAGRPWAVAADGETIVGQGGAAWVDYGPEFGWAPAGLIRQGPYATISEAPVIDRQGQVWIATEADVRVFDGNCWTVLAPEDVGFTPSEDMVEMGYSFRLRDVALDSTGDVWVTDCAWMGPGPTGQGARWFDGETWHGRDSGVVGSGCIEDIEVDGAGRIWAGVDGDLLRYTPGEGWETLPHPDVKLAEELRWGYVTDLTLSDDDTAWVTMAPCGGASCDVGVALLFQVRDGAWTLITDETPTGLAFDATGVGWLCAGDGLYRIEGETATLVYQAEGFTCQLAPHPDDAPSDGPIWLLQPDEPALWRYTPAD